MTSHRWTAHHSTDLIDLAIFSMQSQSSLLPLHRIGLFTTDHEPTRLLHRVQNVLAGHGAEVMLLKEGGDADCELELVIAVGGDGTVLSALVSYPEVPLLAINAGTVGFLTAGDLEDLNSILERVFAGRHFISKRSILKCTHPRGDSYIINGRKMWITNGSIDDAGTPADVVLDERESSASQTVLHVSLHGFWKRPRLGADQELYTEIRVPGLAVHAVPGSPAVPVLNVALAIPDGEISNPKTWLETEITERNTRRIVLEKLWPVVEDATEVSEREVVKRYRKGEQIGTGNFAEVFKATRLLDGPGDLSRGLEVAMKV